MHSSARRKSALDVPEIPVGPLVVSAAGRLMMRALPAETIPGGSPPVSAGGRPRSLRAPEVPVRPLSGSQQQLASLTARVSESPLGPLSRERLGAPLSGEAEAAVSATLPLPYRPSLEGDLLMYNAANASARLPTAMGSSFISKLLSPSAVTAVTTPAAPMIPGSRVRCMPWSCLSEAATDGRPGVSIALTYYHTCTFNMRHPGLRVRMGVATGTLRAGTALLVNSSIFSDAQGVGRC